MQTTFLSKKEVAEGTVTFSFVRPKGFEYKAGQSIDLFLIDPPETDDEGNKRAFSLSSAPHEAALSITTRLRDTAFKRVLRNMAAGTPLSLEGPFGDLTLHEKAARPAVFLSGGIGITPFYSIIKDAAARKLPHKIYLFYSNRRPEDTAFLRELEELEEANLNFTMIATMTEMEKSAKPWRGERGYIDEGMVRKYLPAGADPVYYLAGPAGMVAAMRKLLNGMGVSNDDIRTEEFTGY